MPLNTRLPAPFFLYHIEIIWICQKSLKRCKHINLTPTPAFASACVNTGILLWILTFTPMGSFCPNMMIPQPETPSWLSIDKNIRWQFWYYSQHSSDLTPSSDYRIECHSSWSEAEISHPPDGAVGKSNGGALDMQCFETITLRLKKILFDFYHLSS